MHKFNKIADTLLREQQPTAFTDVEVVNAAHFAVGAFSVSDTPIEESIYPAAFYVGHEDNEIFTEAVLNYLRTEDPEVFEI